MCVRELRIGGESFGISLGDRDGRAVPLRDQMPDVASESATEKSRLSSVELAATGHGE